MRKLALFVLSLLTTAVVSFSQTSTLKGTVTDSVEKKNPSNAVISLLRQSDSVLVRFTRADKDGNFSFTGLKEGTFILMVTHPFMGDYFDLIKTKDGAINDLGNVYMTPKSKLLADVIIK